MFHAALARKQNCMSTNNFFMALSMFDQMLCRFCEKIAKVVSVIVIDWVKIFKYTKKCSSHSTKV